MIYIYIYTYIHTYIHAYIHTYIHTYTFFLMYSGVLEVCHNSSAEVFQCPHPQATMSIEEAADLEIEEMHEIEAGHLVPKGRCVSFQKVTLNCDSEAARARRQVEQEANDADRWCFVAYQCLRIPHSVSALGFEVATVCVGFAACVQTDARTGISLGTPPPTSRLLPRWNGDRYGAKEEWEESQKLQAQGQ